MNDYTSHSDAQIVDAIEQTHALLCAVQETLLTLAAEYDRRQAWIADGAPSLAAWLTAQLGVTHRTGAAWAAVASRLAELPAIRDAFATGLLSLDKVQALAGAATPEDDAALAREAPAWTAAETQRRARQMREVTTDDDDNNHQKRTLRLRWSQDGSHLRLSGRLPTEQGAMVASRLEGIARQALPDPNTGAFAHIDTRVARRPGRAVLPPLHGRGAYPAGCGPTRRRGCA